MKKLIGFIFIMLCCLYSTVTYGQSQAEALMKQAQESLDKKEYTKARSLFLRAYNGFAAAAQYDNATRCGVQVTALYYRENFYKEAFDMLRGTDQLIFTCEQASHRSRPDLRYATVKERLRIYTKLKQTARAKEQLTRLEDLATAANTDSLRNDLLYTKASYFYTFGMNAQGDEAIGKLVGQYKEAKQYDKVIDCYKTLTDIAKKSGNASLTSRAYEQYMIWRDSVKVLKALDDIAALKQECAAKQSVIDEKDSTLQGRQYVIISLCILAAILAGLLVLGAVVLMRFVLLTRKQKRAIEVANEHNEQKNSFISNISAQMSPTLDKLDASQPAVAALKGFIAHIEELSEHERHIADKCELQEMNIVNFCEGIAKQIEGKTKEGVTLTVNAPKLDMAINPDMLGRVLLHLLGNAAIYTPAGGKITLEYKKRGAHTHQFVISDTGCGISGEKRGILFKPFAEVKDLTEGDGLGLPICALLATRMNGTLTLDEDYTKGARFVLELHT
ncbi:MAG: ATP-binding protein [Prevotella sp.]